MPARHLTRIIGVVKAYTTRVGRGPFPTELDDGPDGIGERIRKIGREYGTVTGRPRRVGWFDAVAVRYTATLSGADELTRHAARRAERPGRAEGLHRLRARRRAADHFPSDAFVLERCKPVYETLPGWKEDLTAGRRPQPTCRPRRGGTSIASASWSGCRCRSSSVGPDREPDDSAPLAFDARRMAYARCAVPPRSIRPGCRGTSPSSWTATAAGPASAGWSGIEGHVRGAETVRRVVEECCRLGIGQLTLYCLSSENWKRPQQELDFLMALLKQYLLDERPEIMEQNIRFRVIGRRAELAAEVVREIDETERLSATNTGLTLCLAINYGVATEIVDAVRAIAERVRSGRTAARRDRRSDDLGVALHGRDAGPGPADPHGRRDAREQLPALADLLRRAVGDTRFAGRTSPPRCFHSALRDYAARERRFGGLKTTTT